MPANDQMKMSQEIVQQQDMQVELSMEQQMELQVVIDLRKSLVLNAITKFVPALIEEESKHEPRLLHYINSDKEKKGFNVFLGKKILGRIGAPLVADLDTRKQDFAAGLSKVVETVHRVARLELDFWLSTHKRLDWEIQRDLQAIEAKLRDIRDPVTPLVQIEEELRIEMKKVFAIPGEERIEQIESGSYCVLDTPEHLEEFAEGYMEHWLNDKKFSYLLHQEHLPRFERIAGSGLFINHFEGRPLLHDGTTRPSVREQMMKDMRLHSGKKRHGKGDYWMRGWRDKDGKLRAAHSSYHPVKDDNEEHRHRMEKYLMEGVTGHMKYKIKHGRKFLMDKVDRIEMVDTMWADPNYMAWLWPEWLKEILHDHSDIEFVMGYILDFLSSNPNFKHLRVPKGYGDNEASRRFIEERGFDLFAYDRNAKGPVSIRGPLKTPPYGKERTIKVRPNWVWYYAHVLPLLEKSIEIRERLKRNVGRFPDKASDGIESTSCAPHESIEEDSE